ncbi:hypothetical protein H4582DRAFT_1916606, partial [Lactarius indigo]
DGKPVIAIWGFGFKDSKHTPAQMRALTTFFRNSTPGGAYLLGGAPAHWRTSDSDADSNPDFVTAWMQSFDAISPWTVGRYSDQKSADAFAEDRIQGDVMFLAKWTMTRGKRVAYVPVVHPGGSGFNTSDGHWARNGAPREGGRFLWRQIYNAHKWGARMMYGAMWDEYDEGTQFLPAITKTEDLPHDQDNKFSLIAYDVDGYDVPADWYMRIAGYGSELVKGERHLEDRFPEKELRDWEYSHPKTEIRPSLEPTHASGSGIHGGGSSSAGGEGQSYEDWLKAEGQGNGQGRSTSTTLLAEAEEAAGVQSVTAQGPPTPTTTRPSQPHTDSRPPPPIPPRHDLQSSPSTPSQNDTGAAPPVPLSSRPTSTAPLPVLHSYLLFSDMAHPSQHITVKPLRPTLQRHSRHQSVILPLTARLSISAPIAVFTRHLRWLELVYTTYSPAPDAKLHPITTASESMVFSAPHITHVGTSGLEPSIPIVASVPIPSSSYPSLVCYPSGYSEPITFPEVMRPVGPADYGFTMPQVTPILESQQFNPGPPPPLEPRESHTAASSDNYYTSMLNNWLDTDQRARSAQYPTRTLSATAAAPPPGSTRLSSRRPTAPYLKSPFPSPWGVSPSPDARTFERVAFSTPSTRAGLTRALTEPRTRRG